MSGPGEETKANELVIIRRPMNSEEGGHKGGVWKIAYADFMTAMMAFFLVMWLINASDKQTVTQIATYFNPLRLTDKVPLSKGVHESEAIPEATEKAADNAKRPSATTKAAKEKGRADSRQPSAAGKQGGPASKQQPSAGKGDAKADGTRPKYTEEALFRDPYGALTKLADQAAEDQAQPARRGEAYRDPFDPAFRRETQAEKRDSATLAPATPAPAPGAAETKPSKQPQPPPAPTQPAQETQAQTAGEQAAERAAPPIVPPVRPQVAAPAPVLGAAETKKSTGTQPPPAPTQLAQDTQVQKAAEQAAERAAAAKLEHDIRETIARAIAGALPNITVTVTEEGILVSLTDDQNFGMFAIASAEPRPAMVVLMEKIGKVIADYPEQLVVRGHTDGRPYKSGTYDNWRLSTARAHMAYYMLVRGGIDEKRFERIEGHADRHLKIADDPEAAQNRRIEILLRKAKP